MHIVYLHQYFHSRADFGSTRSYEMSKRFVAAGHRVTIITGSGAGGAARASRGTKNVEGIEVQYLNVGYDNSMSRFRRLLSFVQFAILSSVRGRRLRPDVVLATSTPLTIAIPGWVASVGRAPMVFEVRDSWPQVPIAMGELRNPLIIKVAEKLENFAYRHAVSVVALSPGMRDAAIANGASPERVTVIPNASDLDLFGDDRADGRSYRAERDWLGSNRLALYCGTLGRANGLGFLVDVARAMLDLDPTFRFVVMGKGAEEDAIRAFARKQGVLDVNFFLEAPTSKQWVPSVFAAADIALSIFAPIPALESNSANKFFDALAAGRPVALNYGGWQAELVTAAACGFVLPSADPTAAAHELLGHARDEVWMQNARRNSKALAESQFARDSLADQLEAVLLDASKQPVGTLLAGRFRHRH